MFGFVSVTASCFVNQVSGTEMSKWLNELCPIILDMLQDASLIAKREVLVGGR